MARKQRPTNLGISFAVRNKDEKRSEVWKCWTPQGSGKSDVYITNATLGHRLKGSLHESGKWHFAFDQAFLEANADPSEWPDRFADRWQKPPEIAPGFTLALRILVPFASVSIPIGDPPPPDIAWLPAAEDGMAVEIDLLLQRPGARLVGFSWPGQTTMNTALVGSFPLDDGTTVWLVSRVVTMPNIGPVTLRAGRYFSGHTRQDAERAGVRAILFSEEADGSRVLYEVIGRGPVPTKDSETSDAR